MLRRIANALLKLDNYSQEKRWEWNSWLHNSRAYQAERALGRIILQKITHASINNQTEAVYLGFQRYDYLSDRLSLMHFTTVRRHTDDEFSLLDYDEIANHIRATMRRIFKKDKDGGIRKDQKGMEYYLRDKNCIDFLNHASPEFFMRINDIEDTYPEIYEAHLEDKLSPSLWASLGSDVEMYTFNSGGKHETRREK